MTLRLIFYSIYKNMLQIQYVEREKLCLGTTFGVGWLQISRMVGGIATPTDWKTFPQVPRH